MAWFDVSKRDLPWRRTSDPYAIWISEIMLQQTRVETVISYYRKFLDCFPNVASLARSDLDDVLAAWSGLGYYRRARFLHSAAQEIVRRGGRFPSTLDDLRSLPGVGEYTAAAIGSIAFGLAEPVLDGNVERVLARLEGETGDVKRAATRRELKATARAILDEQRPGATNEAMMELGATVCTPKSPQCEACPWDGLCVAQATGSPESLPTLRPRRPRERVLRTLFVVSDSAISDSGASTPGREESRTLLFKRPDDADLLAGTWELPWVEGHDPPEQALAALAERYGGRWEPGSLLGRVRHSVTYRDLDVAVHRARQLPSRDGDSVRESPLEAGWFAASGLDSIAVSSLVRKALRLAAG